jgi:Zn-dependent protease with chaperone function
MLRGRRSDFLLGGLVLVAIGNGLFLGLTLYGLLAAALKAVHDHVPPAGWAWIVGAFSAAWLLIASLWRERRLRRGEYRLWAPLEEDEDEHPLVVQLRRLTERSTLDRPPNLAWIDSPERNAFTVGRSREEASIVLTAGLIGSLQPRETRAVLAQQLAHVEAEDVRAAGLADAIADSIASLGRAKGRFLWGPTAIAKDLRPILAVSLVAVIATSVLPRSGGSNALLTLFLLGVAFWLLYAFWQAAKRSWRGLAQLFLYNAFFGPMTLVEALLSPPTAILLSRLVSRSRVHEADERAMELTGDPRSLLTALERLAEIEALPTAPWLGERRYSLFVAPETSGGRWPWLDRQRATHPSISSRLERIRELG